MEINFKEFWLNLQEYSFANDSAGVSYNTTSGTLPYQSPNIFTGDSNKGEVPQHNIGLPQVTRRSKIVGMDYKAGGVMEIRLEDRTILKLTHGDFKRIGGGRPMLPDPKTGQHSILTVTFQRSPSDTGQVVSQITSAKCENTPPVRTQS